MKNSRYLFYIVILSLSLILSTCRCNRTSIVINNIFLDIPKVFKELSLDKTKETLREEIKNTINKTQGFSFDEKVESGQELQIILSMPSQKGEKEALLMSAILHNPAIPDGKQYKAWVDIVLENKELKKSDFLKSLNKLLESLYQLRMKGGINTKEYIEIIEKKSKGEKISQTEILNAIAILQEAKDKKSVTAMINLLEKTDDLALGNALMMALGDIGEEEAMPAIIEFAQRKPALIRRQAIIAAKNIGSKLSAEWLLVMAYGYDDPLVRSEAKEALEKVLFKLGIKSDEDPGEL